MKKKLLVICELFPYPPCKSGVCSTIYNFLASETALEYDISVLHFEKDFCNENSIPGIKCDVDFQNIDGYERLCNIEKKLVIKPKGMQHIKSKNMNIIDASKFDFIIFASITVTCIYDKIINKNQCKIVVFEADSPVMFYEREMKIAKKPIRNIYNWMQMKVMKKYEKQICSVVDKIVFVSEVDRKYAAEYLEKKKTQTAKIGVKFLNLKGEHADHDVINIGFSGKMDYKPNYMAASFIIEKIMPALDEMNVSYKVHLIGSNPSSDWVRMSKTDKKLIVTGYVEDIQRYIANMDIFISPLYLGSGMKNKILEALSIGVPVIASDISVEGIEGLKDSENYILCDNKPSNWAKAIVALYQDVGKREYISENGKLLVKDKYSWERFSKELLI